MLVHTLIQIDYLHLYILILEDVYNLLKTKFLLFLQRPSHLSTS